VLVLGVSLLLFGLLWNFIFDWVIRGLPRYRNESTVKFVWVGQLSLVLSIVAATCVLVPYFQSVKSQRQHDLLQPHREAGNGAPRTN